MSLHGRLRFHLTRLFVCHPRGLAGSPDSTLQNASVYDVSDAALAVRLQIAYFPQ